MKQFLLSLWLSLLCACASAGSTPIMSPSPGPSPISASPINKTYGVALTGIFGWGNWYSPTVSDISALYKQGVRITSIPVVYGSDITKLNSTIDQLHVSGMRVHIVPHVDGCAGGFTGAIEQMIFNNFPSYLTWFQTIVNGSSHLRPGDSFELFNEQTPADYNWSHYTILYQKSAPTLAAYIRSKLPGIKVVLPVMSDQSPESAQASLANWDAPLIATIKASAKNYDMTSSHIYWWTGVAPLTQRFQELTAYSAAIGLPLMITEFGSFDTTGAITQPAYWQTVEQFGRGNAIGWPWDNPPNQPICGNISCSQAVISALQTW